MSYKRIADPEWHKHDTTPHSPHGRSANEEAGGYQGIGDVGQVVEALMSEIVMKVQSPIHAREVYTRQARILDVDHSSWSDQISCLLEQLEPIFNVFENVRHDHDVESAAGQWPETHFLQVQL
jgi:hypothetical protein